MSPSGTGRGLRGGGVTRGVTGSPAGMRCHPWGRGVTPGDGRWCHPRGHSATRGDVASPTGTWGHLWGQSVTHRVTVSPTGMWGHSWGQASIGVTHGVTVSPTGTGTPGAVPRGRVGGRGVTLGDGVTQVVSVVALQGRGDETSSAGTCPCPRRCHRDAAGTVLILVTTRVTSGATELSLASPVSPRGPQGPVLVLIVTLSATGPCPCPRWCHLVGTRPCSCHPCPQCHHECHESLSSPVSPWVP